MLFAAMDQRLLNMADVTPNDAIVGVLELPYPQLMIDTILQILPPNHQCLRGDRQFAIGKLLAS